MVLRCSCNDGHRHQLLRSPDIACGNLCDPAFHPFEQPAVLLAAVSIPHLLRRALCSWRTSARCGWHTSRIHPHHAVVVALLCAAWLRCKLRLPPRCTVPTRNGGGRSLPRSRACRGRVGSSASTLDRDGHHQRGDCRRLSPCPATYRDHYPDQWLAHGVLCRRCCWSCVGRVVGLCLPFFRERFIRHTRRPRARAA